MHDFHLECGRCGSDNEADLTTLDCPACGGPLFVYYGSNVVEPEGPQPPGWPGPSIALPLRRPESFVSMGEGNTPSVPLASIGRELGLRDLWAKLEFSNPTGSFKDRGTAVMISVILERGVREIVEDSSGNAGASIAAYAARCGIKAHVFAPDSAPAAKLSQIRIYGAETHVVPGPREAATDAAMRFYGERGLVYATHNRSPYFIEGTKTFAYEVTARLGGRTPGHVVFPVGNGSLYLGAWKGFQELERRGLIDRIPCLHAIQSRAVMPIVSAFAGNPSESATSGETTVAGGIAVASPPRLSQVLDVLRSTGGTAVAVPDEDTLRWQLRLARREGIYAEPTSAAAFAGLERLVKSGVIAAEDTVLVPVTGFGLKDDPPV